MFIKPSALPCVPPAPRTPPPRVLLEASLKFQDFRIPALNWICISNWIYFKVSFVNLMALRRHFPTVRDWLVSSEDWGGPISPPGLLFDIGRQSLGRKPSRTAALDNFPLHRSGLGGNRCLQDILFSSFSDRSLIQVYLSAKSCVGSTLSNLLSWFIIPSVIDQRGVHEGIPPLAWYLR